MRKARDIKSRFGRPETPAAGERRAGLRLYAPLLITVVLGLAVTGLGFFLVQELTQLRWAAWSVATGLLLMFAVTSGFLGSSLRRTQRSQRMARALAREIESREHSERSLRESEARLERQTAALMALTGDRVIRFLDLRRAMQELTERAARALDVARVSVWRFSADQSKLECLEIYASDQDRHSVGGELTVAEYPAYFQALRGCWTLAADDARNDPRTREFASHYLLPLGITSMLVAPVRRGVQLVGIVCHEHKGCARRWTLDEQNFAGSVADLARLGPGDRAARAGAADARRGA